MHFTYVRDVGEDSTGVLLRGYVVYVLNIVVERGVANPSPT